jgi:two-component system OmpR family response regulator
MYINDPRPRILCVDDNKDVAVSITVLLEVFGYESRACYTGRSALAEADLFRPNICIIDLNMPGMDGDELAMRLRESTVQRPISLIAITGMSDEVSRNRIAAAGFDLHLIKPVDPHKLLTAIDQLGKV